MMVRSVSEADFVKLFKKELGEHYQRALTVYKNYGPKLSYDVTNVLLHALDKNKVEEVLTILEKHWNEHLQYQHPEIKGRVKIFGQNPTEKIFLEICEITLGLKAQTAKATK